MSLLRIRASLGESPQRCQWALIDGDREPMRGEGPLADLPRRVERVQLVLPAAQVLFTRVQLPSAARRNTGSLLAFAVEEQTAADPEANQVCWLGTAGEDDVVAVLDKAGWLRWRTALAALGLPACELHCETLMLPLAAGEWSLAWQGGEGFVRRGPLEGAATDCGDSQTPPLSLRLLLEEVAALQAIPAAIAVYTSAADATPDLSAWSRELGIAVRFAGIWNWRAAPADAGVTLAQERQRWQVFAGVAARLRPAAVILAAALAIHALALLIDWSLLASEQRALRQHMETSFRAAFPDAVAVADPALQMRRKLAEARHLAGQADSSDFLPMIEPVALALKQVPVGAVRVLSYEGGRLTLELSAIDESSLRRVTVLLLQSGLSVEIAHGSGNAATASVVLTVQST